ncbi:MAG: N-acetyltransferase [Clostridiales bacterium]|jgi:putative acetyltransferase|nr:N-acetyltransferase [Clostridiales bacterium]
MYIRNVKKEDFDLIYNFVKEAFETAAVKDGDEQDYVLKWRAGESYIPELEFVAVENGEIVGHIMLRWLKVLTDKGAYMALIVAPLSVKLDMRGKGIGAALMNTAFEKAKGLGYSAAFLAGDPNYYKRFGFKPMGEFGIENRTAVPGQFALACEIVDGALKNINGYIEYLE